MSWILAVVLVGQPSMGAEFATEQECVREMRLTIRAMEKEGEKIESVSCTPGIVISVIDEEE
jgi:hypothetical protein